MGYVGLGPTRFNTADGLTVTGDAAVTGAATLSSTLGVTGKITSTAGITFGSDTAAANVLDDYEEGTWTPTYVGGSGSITISGYSFQSGSYTKIGRVVYIQGVLRTTGISGVSGGTYDIAGLPFNVAANLEPSGTPTSGNVIVCHLQSNWTNAPQLFSSNINTTTMRARQGMNVGASIYTNGNTNDFATGSDKNRISFAGWYETDA